MQDYSSNPPPATSELAWFIAGLEGYQVGHALMAQHGEDAHGRCASCRGGGDATGHELWPCYLYRLGQQVAALQRRRGDT